MSKTAAAFYTQVCRDWGGHFIDSNKVILVLVSLYPTIQACTAKGKSSKRLFCRETSHLMKCWCFHLFSAHLPPTLLMYFYLNRWFPVVISAREEEAWICFSSGEGTIQTVSSCGSDIFHSIWKNRTGFSFFTTSFAFYAGFFKSECLLVYQMHFRSPKLKLISKLILNTWAPYWILNMPEICTFQTKQRRICILLTFNEMWCVLMMRPSVALWHLRREVHWLALWGQLKVNVFAFYNSQDGSCFPRRILGRWWWWWG